MKKKLMYYLTRFFLFLGRFFSKTSIYSLSHWMLVRYYHARPKREEILHDNIKRAFPDKDEKEIKIFSRKVYSEVAKMLAETILLYQQRINIEQSVLNKEEVVEKLKQLQSDAPNGILFITAHYGNWELLGLFLGACGFPIVNVVKRSANHWIDEEITTPFRQRYGSRMVEHEGAMITLVKTLKKGKIVSLMIDQVVQPPNGVPVNFFGYPTAATKAVSVLKQKYNPLVVPIFISRVGVEQFEVNVYDPVETKLDTGISEEEQIAVMTQSYYEVIESQIKKSPEQWLWLYNRWKEIKFEK